MVGSCSRWHFALPVFCRRDRACSGRYCGRSSNKSSMAGKWREGEKGGGDKTGQRAATYLSYRLSWPCSLLSLPPFPIPSA